MALYLVQCERDKKARLSNHGEKAPARWVGTMAEANKVKRNLDNIGFDHCEITTVECPKDKQALLDLLNQYSK